MNRPFRNIYEKRETSSTVREKQRQYRVNLISIAIITLECIIGIGVVSYFAVYGT